MCILLNTCCLGKSVYCISGLENKLIRSVLKTIVSEVREKKEESWEKIMD